MRFKSGALFTFVALLAIFGFLLEVSDAAAASKRIQGKDPEGPASRIERNVSKQSKVPSFFAVGGAEDSRPPLAFLKDFTAAECSSGCCWASGCNVSCSESSCTASCGPNDTAEYICR
jgi:hypothetical protein